MAAIPSILIEKPTGVFAENEIFLRQSMEIINGSTQKGSFGPIKTFKAVEFNIFPQIIRSFKAQILLIRSRWSARHSVFLRALSQENNWNAWTSPSLAMRNN